MLVMTGFRNSVRSLARAPGSTLALLFTIALGIGSNASVFGFIHGSVGSTLPLPGIDTIVSLFARSENEAFGPVSYEQYLSLKAHVDVFEVLGAARESLGSVAHGDRSSIVSIAALTPDVANLLQLSLADGIVISDRFRQLEFDETADVRHETLRIDGVDNRIAGVAPAWLESLYAGRIIDIWMPLQEASLQGIDRSGFKVWALGRLRPGVSIARARAATAVTPNGAAVFTVFPYSGMTPEMAVAVSRIGGMLLAAATAVFLIACVNVATFLISRATSRSRDTSLLVALGAGRGQLARQLLWDSVLISAIGGALGVLLAVWTADLIPALFFQQDAKHLTFVPDLPRIVAVSALCAAVTVACGLLPLFEARYDDPAVVLRRESMGPSKFMRRASAAIVAAQMALCCLLVTSSALLFERYWAALKSSAGQRLGQPILATLEAVHGFDLAELGLTYFENADRAVRSLPGITETVWVEMLPGAQPLWQSVRIEPPQLPVRDVMMDVAAFAPRSLTLIKLPPVAGRIFRGADTPQACRVAIVNDEAAGEFPDGDAVGRAVEDPSGQRVEIVGVVANRTEEKAPVTHRPTIYYYAEQTRTPLDKIGPARFRVLKRPTTRGGVLDANVVSAGYFDALGFVPVSGRMLPNHSAPSECRVGVINQEAAERYFSGNAIGGAVIDADGRRTAIIGVVRSVRLRATQRAEEPAIYFPMTQDFRPRMTLMLGSRKSDAAMLASVRRRLASVSGGATVAVTTLDAQLSRTALAPERIATVLVGASAATALALGVFGLFGAMAEAARQRQRESALRIALGAPRWHVIRQVLADGTYLAVAGSFVGMLGSLPVARWLTQMTPTAGPLTVGLWIMAPLVLAVVVAVASVLPARRALMVNPLAIMRDKP